MADEAAALPPPSSCCMLQWACEAAPCFCRPSIRMDLAVLTPTRDTIAAIFGSPDAEAVRLCDAATGADVADTSTLAVGRTYTVRLEGVAPAWVPIKLLATRVDEAAVQGLSRAFYARVWADGDDAAFRALFVNQAESEAAAADAQWRWLVEMWGGAARYSERWGEGSLLRRMLARHGAARMRFRHCRRWLEHMLAASDEVGLGGGDARVAASVRRYWLHFFGFFEMTAAERRELRAMALPPGGAEEETVSGGPAAATTLDACIPSIPSC